jgi:hypothetical protein
MWGVRNHRLQGLPLGGHPNCSTRRHRDIVNNSAANGCPKALCGRDGGW